MTDEPLHSFASVWDALEDTAEAAANMRLRCELAAAVRDEVEHWHLTQAQAAAQLGITQPRLNDLLRGRLTKFSVDALLALAQRAGLTARVTVARNAA